MKKNNSQRVFESKPLPFLIFLILFALATLGMGYLYPEQRLGLQILAASEGVAILGLLIYSFVSRRKKRRALRAYIESVAYDVENAKNRTLLNFPLPIVVFRLSDSRIVWGNEMFFSLCSQDGARTEASVAELIPEFSGKWLVEGKSQYPGLLEHKGRKYQVSGTIVSSAEDSDERNFMGITYWTDVTDYDNIRREYEISRPVAAVITIDNFEELTKNQPERIRNDLRDAVGDKLTQWGEEKHGILIRTDRDRYLMVFEERYMGGILEDKFRLLEDAHKIMSPSGIHATLSIGIGRDAADLSEAMQFASVASEMALSRGGDQAVIKNRFNFEFFGGRHTETETRSKVRSRVMANALDTLVRDASQVLVMGHRYSDMDSIGSAVAVCCLARKNGVRVHIVADTEKTFAKNLITRLKKEPIYESAFISTQEAMLIADSKTLLVVVDTNRPEQVEDLRLLQSCNKVAVIDHHRRAATYIERADLSYIEPSASSVCELMAEILEVALDKSKLLRCEAEAVLSGIVLDTKSFTLRTNDRTFDAAAYLRRAGADTAAVKRLMQSDKEQMIERSEIIKDVKLYRKLAIAVPSSPHNRIVAAQAADELLNVSGVEASVVMCPGPDGSVLVSARSIGSVNVQILMEKLGGGGNKAAAAAQLNGTELSAAVKLLYNAIDEYFDT